MERQNKKAEDLSSALALRVLASSRIYCSGVTLVSQLVIAVVE